MATRSLPSEGISSAYSTLPQPIRAMRYFKRSGRRKNERELSGGYGVHSVLECVGLEQSLRTALEIARPGGAVGRVGAPQDESIPEAVPMFFRNVTGGGGVAPARAYIEGLLPDVFEGRIEPGRVFDRIAALDEVPDGYRAMNDREAVKVMVEF